VPYVTAHTSFLFANTTSIQIPNELAKHELTKHIGVDGFFSLSHWQQSTIHLDYVPSELQLLISSQKLKLASET
jgi:hypothetical protein